MQKFYFKNFIPCKQDARRTVMHHGLGSGSLLYNKSWRQGLQGGQPSRASYAPAVGAGGRASRAGVERDGCQLEHGVSDPHHESHEGPGPYATSRLHDWSRRGNAMQLCKRPHTTSIVREPCRCWLARSLQRRGTVRSTAQHRLIVRTRRSVPFLNP